MTNVLSLFQCASRPFDAFDEEVFSGWSGSDDGDSDRARTLSTWDDADCGGNCCSNGDFCAAAATEWVSVCDHGADRDGASFWSVALPHRAIRGLVSRPTSLLHDETEWDSGGDSPSGLNERRPSPATVPRGERSVATHPRNRGGHDGQRPPKPRRAGPDRNSSPAAALRMMGEAELGSKGFTPAAAARRTQATEMCSSQGSMSPATIEAPKCGSGECKIIEPQSGTWHSEGRHEASRLHDDFGMDAAHRDGYLDKHYSFEHDVGQWAYGMVQVRRDAKTGELVTCKSVPKASVKNPTEVLEKLLSVRGLRHKYINSIVDALEDDQNIYIISEHCSGGDIADWMAQMEGGYVLAENTCAAYVKMVLIALAHCHSNQVYHRDISPSRVVLTSKMPDAEIRVCDCGVAAILDPGHTAPHSAPAMKEDTHAPSLPWVSDMWSIGALAQTLLTTGKPPARDRLEGLIKEMSFALSFGPNLADEVWLDRSSEARDFVDHLFRAESECPTADQALQHPWLKAVTLRGNSPQMQKPGVAQHYVLCPRQNARYQAMRHARLTLKTTSSNSADLCQ
eukprot:gnl/TRDRNA2_/TRDRNA2_157061_c0_seq1.p1 gnl/TRDRNA2_/TRDRNA2_157061_c0~~gnl/TRDRNA2_/TRDRNA2_157061_c0_seq1.p1  ORF type:complete len:567 (+),score=61.59 gnl/TRDRNA2_/TRDRNA2_157061_c0_seq1:101-1801(+)